MIQHHDFQTTKRTNFMMKVVDCKKKLDEEIRNLRPRSSQDKQSPRMKMGTLSHTLKIRAHN